MWVRQLGHEVKLECMKGCERVAGLWGSVE